MALSGIFLKTFNFLSNGRLALNPSFRKEQLYLQSCVMTSKRDARDKLKKLDIPEKPKRPLTPYLRFVKEQRLSIVKEKPDWKQSEIIKKCAEDWKNVSEVYKEKYTQLYKSEHEAYDKEMITYLSSLTAEQKDALKAAAEETKSDRQNRKIRKFNKETNKPKKPVGPYILYLMEQSRTRNIPLKDLISSRQQDWINLPEDAKARYKTQYLKDKERYEADMKQWEDKMIREDHEDLVRTKSLKAKRSTRISELKGNKSE